MALILGERGLGRREKRAKPHRPTLGGILAMITEVLGISQDWRATVACRFRDRTDLSLHLA